MSPKSPSNSPQPRKGDATSPKDEFETFAPSVPQSHDSFPPSPSWEHYPQQDYFSEPFAQQPYQSSYNGYTQGYGQQPPSKPPKTMWIVTGVAAFVVIALVAVLWGMGTFDSREEKASDSSSVGSSSSGKADSGKNSETSTTPNYPTTFETPGDFVRVFTDAYVNYHQETLESLLCENAKERTRSFISDPKIDKIVQKYDAPYFVFKTAGNPVEYGDSAFVSFFVVLTPEIEAKENEEPGFSIFSKVLLTDLEKTNGSWCMT